MIRLSIDYCLPWVWGPLCPVPEMSGLSHWALGCGFNYSRSGDIELSIAVLRILGLSLVLSTHTPARSH